MINPSHWTCGNSLDGMPSIPDKLYDVIITDPPYSEHVQANSPRGDSANVATAPVDMKFSHMTREQAVLAAREFARIAKRWTIIFCDAELVHVWKMAIEAAGLEYIRTGAWVKKGATPQFSGDRPAAGFDSIVIAHPPGKKQWNGGGRHAIWTGPTAHGAGDDVQHVTQKPLWLMESLIRDFTNPGELILDPYGGVATTGVAAIRNGRLFGGFEIDPHYHAIGEHRLKRARQQLDLFTNDGSAP